MHPDEVCRFTLQNLAKTQCQSQKPTWRQGVVQTLQYKMTRARSAGIMKSTLVNITDNSDIIIGKQRSGQMADVTGNT